MVSDRLRAYSQERFAARQQALAPIMPQIQAGLDACTPDEAVLMQFFYGTMPLRDAAEYAFGVFLRYVQHALWLRENVAWCRDLPEALFVHHVLYYRINSEDISDCRAFFYEQLKDRIAGLTLKQAVLEVNWWCAEHAMYQTTDGRTASPMTMYHCGKGRCGEESTFAVTALRSVGIAARQVYTPRWAHCDDNHAWVEAYVDGSWHFLGACEPESELDRGWFVGPAGRALLIHSRTFGDYAAGETEELIGRHGLLVYHNHTAAYTRTRALTIHVKDRQGRAAAGAAVSVDILNMAEYCPCARLTADAQGTVVITMGLGDFRVHAAQDGFFAEHAVHLAQESEITLTLTQAADAPTQELVRDAWEEELVRAPQIYVMHEGQLTPEQQHSDTIRLAEANRLREARFAAAGAAERAAHPEEAEILLIAGENAAELTAFLDKDDDPDRAKLLHALVPKDYKDLKAAVLEDHLHARRGDWPEEVHVRDLLCPRILLEELRPYRSYIRAYFTAEQQQAFAQDPTCIWAWICANIVYDANADYDTVCATPVGCLTLRQGSPLSRKILFVAICRSLNIPARIERSVMQPQYWQAGGFRALDCGADSTPQTATLRLTRGADEKWDYFHNWTLARLVGAQFVTMDYWELPFDQTELTLPLGAGVYRLITTERLPNGDQRTASRVFALADGESKQLRLHACAAGEPTERRPLGDLCLRGTDGQTCPLGELTAEHSALLAFLGIGAEPTEHVLNELLDAAADWNAKGNRLLAVLKGPEDLENPTLQKVLAALSGVTLFWENGTRAETAARMDADAARLPVLIALQKGGMGAHACSGYNVGSVELLRKLLD